MNNKENAAVTQTFYSYQNATNIVHTIHCKSILHNKSCTDKPTAHMYKITQHINIFTNCNYC